MAAFDKVADSVRAAADIQQRFASYNADASESLRVRIGIHAGEPVADHNDLFGTTVQLAYVAKQKPMESSSPGSFANLATRIRRALLRLASAA
jgi:hypothetical protein